MHFSTSLLGFSALAMFLATAQAQDNAAPPVVAPPQAGAEVKILYSNDGNGEIATETVPFNKCFSSEHAFLPYSYLTFSPNNATINFYTDSNCDTFTFGLDGYYGGYPGTARSFRWVGWDSSVTNLGELFNKGPIRGQGDAANPDDNTHTAPPGGQNPGTPVTTNPDNSQGANPETKTPEKSSSSSTFFGGVFGSLIVLSVGGLIFWKTAGKKLVQDKGKGVLPYNRVGGRGDGDILLTNSGRAGHNSFEIGDEDDDEDEVDTRRQHRSGRQERYHDDDHA
ncbi:hypothetical protein FBU30_001246 [Linnemannia zychae]|nr:hypothetical protein FBU30_001246 [Linnemannia zychae]